MLITITHCFDIVEANRLRMALESAGIPVFIPDELTATAAPHFLGTNGIRVQVPDEYEAQAREIVGEEQ